MKNKKKALIIATVIEFVIAFEMNDIRILQDLGYEVIVAANCRDYNEELNNNGIEILDIRFTRSPFTLENLKAFKKLNKFVKENDIDLIHCHTPVGGVVGRIVGKLNKVKTVIYTAHGFHFFDGAPKLNWLIYYPIEKFLSRYTDILITINQEDYNRAKSKFYAKRVEYIPGVGVDIEKIKNIKVDRKKKKEELGINQDNIVLLSVGELSSRKNHITPIRALAKIKNKNVVYLIAGVGPLETHLKEEVKKLNLEDQVKFLGFRKDVYELCKISDIYVFPSKQEGLPVALMEAICCDLPLVCSNIRGNTDLIENNKNGFLVEDNSKEYINKINLIIENSKIKTKLMEYNKKIVKKIDIKNIENKMCEIYKLEN